MGYKSDIEIAQEARPEQIQKIAEDLNISDEYLELSLIHI